MDIAGIATDGKDQMARPTTSLGRWARRPKVGHYRMMEARQVEEQDVHFALRVVRVERRMIVFVTGDLELRTAPILEERVARLLRERPWELRLDLADVTFCDAAGMGALLQARAAACAHGCVSCFVAVPQRLRRLFRLVQLDELLGD